MRFFKSVGFAFSLLVALAAAPAHAGFDQCKQFFAGATTPAVGKAPGHLRELCFDGFAVLHSGESRTPVFVVERLSRASLLDARDEKRTDRFYEEARLPRAERATLDDYRGSGLDRGHLAAAANRATPESMAQSFSLANMVPQAPQNNRKAWASIEQATRKYVMRAKGDVFVYTGVAGLKATIGKNEVWVPQVLYKLVYDSSNGKAWAHWLSNNDEARVGPPITYEELVRRTGIEFIPALKAN
ncbi:Nuclease precursor [compost metagenome]